MSLKQTTMNRKKTAKLGKRSKAWWAGVLLSGVAGSAVYNAQQPDIAKPIEIVKYEGELVADYEGCLSVSGIYGKVPRYSRVRVKALDIDGNEIRLKADGFLARVLQHEIDHTNGTVFIDHIRDDHKAFYTLDEQGELQSLDYEEHIEGNHDLWQD